MLGLALLVFLPKSLVGFFLIDSLWPDSRRTAFLLKFFAGILLGLAIFSSMMFLALRAGISPQIYSRAELGLSLLIGLPLLARNFRRIQSAWRPPDSSFARDELTAILIILAGAILSMSAFLYFSFQHPNGFSDAWTIWNLPARFIYRTNDPGLIFRTADYVRFHPDYPLMLSLNVTWGWEVLGLETTRVQIALAAISSYLLAGVLGAAITHFKNPLQGALAALIFLMAPDFEVTISQYADALLAGHILLTGVFIAIYIKTADKRTLVLAGLFAGFAAWVKNEGLLFIAASSAVCIWAVIKSTHRWRDILSYLAGLLFPVFIVGFFKLTVQASNDLVVSFAQTVAQMLDPSRYIQIAAGFLRYGIDFGGWPVGVFLVLAAYSLFTGFSKTDNQSRVAMPALFLIQLAGYFAIYLVTPYNLQTHIYTSIERLLFHVYPLVLLWLFYSLKVPPSNSETATQEGR